MLSDASEKIRDKVTNLVISILADNEIHQAFTAEDTLPDIGFSSVDMVNLMLGIEAEFDITIPQGEITPEHFRSVATIESLVARILHGGQAA